MDVRRGHCWRCEQPIGGVPLYCKLCWIAVYCSEVCLASDLFRHSVPECEIWGPKQCSNSKCGAIGQSTKFLEVRRSENMISFFFFTKKKKKNTNTNTNKIFKKKIQVSR